MALSPLGCAALVRHQYLSLSALSLSMGGTGGRCVLLVVVGFHRCEVVGNISGCGCGARRRTMPLGENG